jgi:MFS family permease
MLSLAMFRRASFTTANGISFCLFAGLFGALFLMSQFFQTAQGRSPLQAGAQLLVWSATGLFVAPIAGRLAGRHGNRPFMLTGLLLQTAGLAGLAIIARRDVAFGEMAPLLTIAGVGTSMVFPAVANEVMTSIGPNEAGIASGTNSALRELGGVFGVAVLASVFSRPGVYSSPEVFVAGFRSALWIAVAFSAAGILLALYRKRATTPKPEPAVSLGGIADHPSGQQETAAGPLAMLFDTTLDQTGPGRETAGDDLQHHQDAMAKKRKGIWDDEAQSHDARGVAGCSRRVAGAGEGADPPRRPARGRAARAALGADREGIQLRHR